MAYAFKAHTADVRMQVSGKTLRALFKSALAGMTALAKPEAPGARVTRSITLSAPDATSLLIDFLNEALLLMVMQHEAYVAVVFERLDERELMARLEGVKVEGFRTDIKAVTYHEAALMRGASGNLETTVIFDI